MEGEARGRSQSLSTNSTGISEASLVDPDLESIKQKGTLVQSLE